MSGQHANIQVNKTHGFHATLLLSSLSLFLERVRDADFGLGGGRMKSPLPKLDDFILPAGLKGGRSSLAADRRADVFFARRFGGFPSSAERNIFDLSKQVSKIEVLKPLAGL